MADQPVVIQKISWNDLCPWTTIFRTLPIATSFTVLALALLATVVTPMGWRIGEAFLPTDVREAKIDEIRNNHSPYRGVFSETPDGVRPLNMLGVRITGPREVFRQLVNPFKRLFDRQISMREYFYYLFGSLWTVAVWGFAGVAICRVCLLRLTRNEFAGLDDAFEFAVDNWPKVVGAILAPLAAVAVLCIPTFVLGLLMGFDLGVMLVGLLWFIVTIVAFIMGILLLGLLLGWPLMVASIGCESQTSFDAITRSYAYVFQKPFHYLFYAALAILFGGIAWTAVSSIADGMIGLTYWSVSWGAEVSGDGRLDTIINGAAEPATESQSMYLGRRAIGFWNAVIKSLAAAFLYGLFWCLASAIYLLMRKDVDEAEMDEIFLMDERRTYQLPPLQSDENGIPQVRRPEPTYSADQSDQPLPDQVSPDDAASNNDAAS